MRHRSALRLPHGGRSADNSWQKMLLCKKGNADTRA